MSRFFIDRPIFAVVIALIIIILGIISIFMLPRAQYPDIAPPSVTISATYTGASAETVENTVTQVIERELTGLDGLTYFSATSSSNGSCSIKLTFSQETDPDTAQVQTQNKIQQISNRLPSVVQQNGITVTKSQSNMLMLVALYDTKGKATDADIADWLVTNVQDRLARVDGVGGVDIMGDQYAMRIWMNPLLLKGYDLTPGDVRNAIKQHNRQASMGKLGDLPAVPGQNLIATVTAPAMLETPAQFREIIIKYKPDGSVVKLGDVAEVEMGSERYSTVAKLNNLPSGALAIKLASGANAMATSDNIHALMKEFEPSLPDGYAMVYANDNSSFVKLSIQEVVQTMVEAVILVVIVMFIFLGSWRATIIPAVTVPVVLLGSFAIMKALGYTINTLTLFGLVLSIGLLIDDTIVVVENVERLMLEKKLSPRQATVESMGEIAGALVGITAIIIVVFMPMIFFSGSTGIIYRQFSVTMIASISLSVLMALTLAPALCALLLKAHNGEMGRFQRLFYRVRGLYENRVSKTLQRPVRWLVAYVVISGGAVLLLLQLSTGFLPTEDQGVLICMYSMPAGADMSRTNAVSKIISDYFVQEEKDNIETILTTDGFSSNSSGQSTGMAFITLKDWSLRTGKANSAEGIASRAMMKLSEVRDAKIFVINLPAIMGLGQTDGFEFYLQAASGTDRTSLQTQLETFLEQVKDDKILSNVRSDNAYVVQQLHLNFNTEKALSYGIAIDDIYDTLGTAWAGEYVNDFIDRSRVKKVYIQSKAEFRAKPEDLKVWSVRNSDGQMVQYSEFTETTWVNAPETLERFNGVPAYYVQGSAASGYSSGDAMAAVGQAVSKLPKTTFSWSGLSYEENRASGQTAMLYGLSILIIFLCLAALYESWSIPIAVLLVIPLGVLGAVLGAYFRDLENNIYFQVALVTIIGLSARNAILMVEFAAQAHKKSGLSLFDAARQAAALRLRPILMTALTFGAGVLPLAISSGVGANSRIAIGTGTLGGTLSSTCLSIFFIPLFFLLVSRLFAKKKERSANHNA